MASFERCQSNEYEASILMSIDNLNTMMEIKKSMKSKEFTCSDDPNQPMFQLWLRFGLDEDGWMSTYLMVPESPKVSVQKVTFTAYDVDMNYLESSKIDTFFSHPGIGFTKYYSFTKMRDSLLNLLRIKCEVFYNGDAVERDSTTIKPRDPNLPENMIAILDSTKYADVTFLVGGEKIKAHKNILTARSDYFKRMFDSGMQECATDEVEIKDAEPLEFKEFLKFLYSGLPPKNLPEIATSLLPLADRYGMLVLKEMCIDAIRGSLSISNVIEVLLLSDLFDYPDLMKICIRMFKGNVDKLTEGASWIMLTQKPDLMAKVLKSFNEK